MLGLQGGPTEAWRWDSSHDHPLYGTVLQGNRIATIMRMDQDDDATVHIRDAATGQTVWQHSLGVSLTDGQAPPWWPSAGGVSVVDGVALVAETGPVVAIDLQSGEELWRSNPGNWGTLTDGESLYLLPRSGGDLQRVDPRTGTVRWSVTVPISIDAGWDGTAPGTLWHGDPVVRQSRGSQGSTLVRFDSHTGREVMRLDVEVSPDDQQTYVGEDQLVILLTHERDRGEYRELLTDRALGVDPDTGEIRWDQTFKGHVGVVGRHLAAMDDDWAVTFYR